MHHYNIHKEVIHHSPEVRRDFTIILDLIDRYRNKLIFVLPGDAGNIQ